MAFRLGYIETAFKGRQIKSPAAKMTPLTFDLQNLVWRELQACQFCFQVPTMGSHSVRACSTGREVHFLRWINNRDQLHPQHTCRK